MRHRFLRAKRLSANRGQSIVELATTLLLLLLVLFAIADLGLAWFAYVTVSDAAQEGATYASTAFVDGSDTSEDLDNVQSAVIFNYEGDGGGPINALNGGPADVYVCIPPVTASPESCVAPSCVNSGDKLQVWVVYDYTLRTPLESIVGLLSRSIGLSGGGIPISVSSTSYALTGNCP